MDNDTVSICLIKLIKENSRCYKFGILVAISGTEKEIFSHYDREKLQGRLAKLVGGVGVIRIRAATETELKEKKARVEDPLNATRSAVEEGVVTGGDVALVRCLSALQNLSVEGDEKHGESPNPGYG